MWKDFFISYTQADKAWAEWVAWELEEAHYETTLQAWDSLAGSNFVLEMQKATTQAERTIAILSPEYLAAVYIQPEWASAFVQDPTGAQGKLLPVRVRECVPTGMLASIVYIDLVDLPEAQAKETLLARVRRERAKPAIRPVFPGTVKHSASTQPHFPGAPYTPRFEGPGKVPACEVPHFMGRDEDLAKLRQTLAGGDSAVCVVAVGLGGIGKTALVQQFVATEAKALFPAGSAWLDGMSLLVELRRVAEQFGYAEGQPPSAEVAIQWLAGQLHDQPVLLVVDNVDPSHVDVKHLPMPGGRCRTILTSRWTTLGQRLEVPAQSLELNRWDKPTCRTYFRKVVPKLIDVPDKELDDLTEFVGALPLAIRLLSRLLARPGATPVRVLARLKKAPITTLDEVAANDKGVAATFVLSFEDQTHLHQKVLVALAACAQGTSAELVAEVAGVAEEGAADALQKLAEQSLAECTDGPTKPWGLHDVVRLFVRHHQKAEFQHACSRLVAWATKYAAEYTIDVWIRDHRDRFERLYSCEANLMLAWRWANETATLPKAIILWENLWVYLEMAYQWDAAIQESRKTLNLLATDANKYRLIERWLEVNSLGFCQLKLGRLEEAERTLTHALDALTEDPPAGGDWGTSPLAAGMPHVLKSVGHRHLAAVYQEIMQKLTARPEDLEIMRKRAQAEAEAALSCAKQIDAHLCPKESAVNVAVSQVTLVGSLQQTAGHDVKVLETALGLLDSALKELGSIGDDWRLASAYLVKGRTLKNLKRYPEAKEQLWLSRLHSEQIKRLDTDRNATRELLAVMEKLGDVPACNRLRDDLSRPPTWAKTR